MSDDSCKVEEDASKAWKKDTGRQEGENCRVKKKRG